MKQLRTRGPLLLVLLAGGLLALAAGGCSKKLDPRLQEGYDLVVQGKVDEAIALANALLAEDPKNAPARNLIGLALYKAGDIEGAVNQYRQALEIDDGYPEAHFNLGNAYNMLGRQDEAEAEFKLATSHQSKFVQAHYNLAVIYRDSDRPEQALAEFRKCVELDPQFYYAYLGMGQMYYDSGDFEDAVTNITRALELSPTQKELRVLLGNALLQTGRPDAPQQAEEAFRAAVSIDSTYVDAVYNLGVALAAQNRPADAAKCFRDVLELTENNPAKSNLVEHVNRFLEDLEKPAGDSGATGAAG